MDYLNVYFTNMTKYLSILHMMMMILFHQNMMRYRKKMTADEKLVQKINLENCRILKVDYSTFHE